jgi:formate dehydrogenase major subunit
MTNHWNDISNSDVMLALGGNPCENHPAAIAHMMAAKDKGAKLISVDPRFTRTSAKADIYAPIRSGTDVCFIGGIINWVIADIEANQQNYNMTYITEYTNASFLVNPDFKGPADLEGLYSGYNGGLNETDNSKLRRPVVEKTLFQIHTRKGISHHRNVSGLIPRSSQRVCRLGAT